MASITDSGETIAYVYDSLQRLTSATGSGWSQGFAYDGFGNMTAKTGTGSNPETFSVAIDSATNRLSGVSYDPNGNQLFAAARGGMTDSFNFTYDVSNRMIAANNSGPSIQSSYEYDPGNKRIWEKRVVTNGASGEWFYFFGITGQRLARYNFTIAGAVITFTQDNASVWFGGKLVQKINTFGTSFASEDRLGSVGKYMPYGEDKPGTSNPLNDNEKFATYTRDSGTGIDYANQRWHAQGTGRFLTGDPYQASGGTVEPGSWNRYCYVGGDPLNFNDPSGLQACNLAGLWSFHQEDTGRLGFRANIHCTSLAGTINKSIIYEAWDALPPSVIAREQESLYATVNYEEDRAFRLALTMSRGRIMGILESHPNCAAAIGASSREDLEDRLWVGLLTDLQDFGPVTIRVEPSGQTLPVPNSTNPNRVWPLARWTGSGMVCSTVKLTGLVRAKRLLQIRLDLR